MQQMMGRMFGSRPKKKLLSAAGLWGVELVKTANDDLAGISVRQVWPMGAADRAGMKPGDRLLTIDGRWTESPEDAIHAASFAPPGRPVAVVVERGADRLELEVEPQPGL